MRRIALAVWVVCLLIGSFLPWRAKVAIGAGRRVHFIDLVPYPWLSRLYGHDLMVINPHRIVHYFAFGLTAFLLALFLRSQRNRFIASLAVFVLAICIEIAQHLLFHNPLEWFDVRDDFAGILTALAIVQIVRTIRRPQPAGGESANPEASGK